MYTEEQQEVMRKVQKFYARIGTITQDPNLLTQEEGVKLVSEATDIINALNKLDSINGFEALIARFEVIKHRLLQTMLTTPTQQEE